MCSTRRLLLGLAVVVGGCNDGTTGPIAPPPPPPALGPSCSPGDTVRLAVDDGITVDCSQGTTITLAGGGASYLIVPQLASGGIGRVTYDSTTFTLDLMGGGGSGLAMSRGRASGAPRPMTAQRAFDRIRRGHDRTIAASVRRSAAIQLGPAPGSARAVPAVGDVRSFHVLADTSGNAYKTISATLRYAGQNVYLYLDQGAPASGFSDQDLTGFGKLVDQVLYSIDLTTFGAPTDLDQNGHVIMLLTPAVNALTSSASCSTEGFVAGFFDGIDLSTDSNSNQGEVFYGVVPDPSGTTSCAHTVAGVVESTPVTFLHELQHMISFGQHVLVRQGEAEEGWLDEGLSLIAEEEGARYYEAMFPPPTGRTSATQIFPDSAEGFISDLLLTSYDYLSYPDTVSLTLHTDEDAGLQWRGGDWLLMRYLGDQMGEGVFKTLEQSSLTGAANLEAVMGLPLSTLLGNFSIAAFVDSLPSVPRSSIPSRYRFRSRNLRELYNAVYNVVGPLNGIPDPFPITVLTFTPNGGPTGGLVPGGMAYFGLTTAAGAAGVALQFGTSTGSPINANLHPQVNIFRLQ